MSRWRKPLKDFVKKKCKGILTISFPAAAAMTGEEVKAFLSAISRLPEVMWLLKNEPRS